MLTISLTHRYDERTREIQRKIGPAPAQIYHFARLLRNHDPEEDKDNKTITYRLFMDRRWDSLYGHYLVRRDFQVSCTSTVMAGRRYHVANAANFPTVSEGDPKALNKRGKYRSAMATMPDGITFRCCAWADSKVVYAVSTDLGTEEDTCERRVGRHIKTIACPRILTVRGKYFRAVDQNDQLRMGKWHFDTISRKKPWHKVFFSLIEMLLVNIYIIAKQSQPTLSTCDFRWALIFQLLKKADEIDAAALPTIATAQTTTATTVPLIPEDSVHWQDRWHPDSVTRHHHDTCADYCTPEQAELNRKRMALNPSKRVSLKKPRDRDKRRRNGLVRNPMFTGGADCVVCKYHPDPSKRRSRRTNRYCRECSVDSGWPFTLRCTGYQLELHPRLCSDECWKMFHTTRISLLDNAARKKRKRKSKK